MTTSADAAPKDIPATDLQNCASADEVIDRLIALYDGAVAEIETQNFETFAQGNRTPCAASGLSLPRRSRWNAVPHPRRSASARCRAGLYGTTITEPRLFRDYLIEQLNLLMPTARPRSYRRQKPHADPADLRGRARRVAMSAEQRLELAQPLPPAPPRRRRRLRWSMVALLAGRRRAGRCRCSPPSGSTTRCTACATTPAPTRRSFQSFVLFTNYQRYIDEFVAYGR